MSHNRYKDNKEEKNKLISILNSNNWCSFSR